MSEEQQANRDPLEAAIAAIVRMSVPERPPDAEVLASLGGRLGDLSGPTCLPLASKRRSLMRIVLFSSAAAVLLFGSLALFLWNNWPPESVQVAGPVSSDKVGDVAVEPPPRGAEMKRESLRESSIEKQVADAQVIVVATALDSARAAPRRPGDRPETLLRFQVKRILKGEWANPLITTQTPTAADEFIGKDWVLLLSPDYMAGKHRYASCMTIKLEPNVTAILSKVKK
jgi:hypothetical protein